MSMELYEAPDGEVYYTMLQDDGSRIVAIDDEWVIFPDEWDGVGEFRAYEEEGEEEEAAAEDEAENEDAAQDDDASDDPFASDVDNDDDDDDDEEKRGGGRISISAGWVGGFGRYPGRDFF